MRKLLAFGLVKAGQLVTQVTSTGEQLKIANPPRSDRFMVPVIKNGVVIGYQDFNSSDNTIYELVKEVIVNVTIS